jgi:hypothetical protein
MKLISWALAMMLILIASGCQVAVVRERISAPSVKASATGQAKRVFFIRTRSGRTFIKEVQDAK